MLPNTQVASNNSLRPFPTPLLVILSVASCFVASAALVSSFTQVATHVGYFVVPSIIGFIAAVPYHVHMYCLAKAHRHNPSESDPVFIANEWIIYNFLLITLWAVIFIINILFCDGERGVAGIIVTTIWSGVEWIVLLLLAVLTIVEIRRSKPGYTGTPETQPLLPGQPDTTHTLLKKVFLKNLIFFLSYTLCTLVLVLGIDLHLPVLFNVIAFFLTAPHHIALYISSARPSSPFKFFPFLATFTGVPYAFFLSAAWIGVVILNILMSRYLYQAILVGVFGSLECAIVSYLAIRSVLDDLAEEQIKL